jgi:hypothetical protein
MATYMYVPITPHKAFELGCLAMRVLSAQVGLDPATCFSMLRMTVARLYQQKIADICYARLEKFFHQAHCR